MLFKWALLLPTIDRAKFYKARLTRLKIALEANPGHSFPASRILQGPCRSLGIKTALSPWRCKSLDDAEVKTTLARIHTGQ